jgi:hypothetical protein
MSALGEISQFLNLEKTAYIYIVCVRPWSSMQYTIVIDMDGNIRIDRLPLGCGMDHDIIKGSCMYAVFSKFKNCEISEIIQGIKKSTSFRTYQ